MATSANHPKKKTKRAKEQEREDIKTARPQFQEEGKCFRAEDILAVDEMGCVTGMSRPYGYAPCGERVVSYEPAGKGRRLSLIGVLSVEGFLGGVEVTGSVNGDVFDAFLEQVVVPYLSPGKVVVVDNGWFHHRERIQEIIEGTGAIVKFLPAYSPEFNPLDAWWSKLNAWLRKKAARTVAALQEAITEAIQPVTPRDAEGWFRHAGYQFNADE
jgi:transposase